jgi:hypothetical protein
VIGTIYKSEYQEVEANGFESDDGKRGRIVCEGVVWKYRYPAYAAEVIERHMNSKLFVSMETYFAKCTCSECNQEFLSKDHTEGTYCEHLNYRRLNENSKAYRVFADNIFGGTGVVRNPADVDAAALALAREQRKEGSHVEKEYTKADVDKFVAEALEKTKSGQALEAAKAEIEELKSKLGETKELSEKLVEAEKALEAAKAEAETAQKELDELKADIAKAKVVGGRMRELVDTGYELPEDEEELNSLRSTIAEFTDNGFKLFVNSVKIKKSKDEKESDDDSADASIRIPAGMRKADANKNDSGDDNKLGRMSELFTIFFDDPNAQ